MESLTRQTRQKQAVLQALAASGLSLAPAEILLWRASRCRR